MTHYVRRTTYDRPRTTPRVWRKLPTGELKMAATCKRFSGNFGDHFKNRKYLVQNVGSGLEVKRH